MLRDELKWLRHEWLLFVRVGRLRRARRILVCISIRFPCRTHLVCSRYSRAFIYFTRTKKSYLCKSSSLVYASTICIQSTLLFHPPSTSISYPTGTGDLLADASLVLSYSHRYGLVGRNGSGKTTLMRSLATYALPGLDHLKIMLVDQHVEGDDDTPMQV
jgi:hypothetical protein